MTYTKQMVPVVNARYIKNRTKRGNVTAKQMARAVQYIGYGHIFENPQQHLRGQWYNPDGEDCHSDVVAWSEAQAQTHKYTYTFILSLRDGMMQDSDFTEALQSFSADVNSSFPADWRVMVHRDSDHDHAHLVLFRDRTLRKPELAQWRDYLQQALSKCEEQRLIEQRQQEQSSELD